MPATRIVIALEPGRVSPEAIELGHVLGLATGASLTLLAVWRWWEPVELAMIAGEHSLREEAHDVLRDIGHRLRSRGHSRVDERLRAATSIGSALHGTAEEATTGLLVLGPAHRGPTGRVLAAARHPTSCTGPRAPSPSRRAAMSRRPAGRSASASRTPIATRPRSPPRRSSTRALRRSPLHVIAVADTRIAPELTLAPGSAWQRSSPTAARPRRGPSSTPWQRSGDLTAEAVMPKASRRRVATPLTMSTCWSADRASYGQLGALLLGSVSRPLLHRAPTPLLVSSRAGASDGWNSCSSIPRRE